MPSTICTNHPEKDLEYFCSEHDCSCCILCKRNEHIECQRIEKIEENIAEISLQDEFINLKTKTKRDIQVLNILSSTTDKNISKLNEDKESLYEQMKTTRQEVIKTLDAFETNITSNIEEQFDKENEELRKRKDTYLQKLSELEKFQHMLHTIVDINMEYNTSLFLLYEKSKRHIKQDQSVVENCIASIENVVTECEVRSEIDVETLCLCVVGDECVAVAGRDLHKVLYLNIKTSAVKSVPLPGYSLMKFLTPFCNDSVLLSICGENKIYKINFALKECELCDTSVTLQNQWDLILTKLATSYF
ncbi:unnamed protein product [Mytilus edulis]|uniref:B box-type domain-containing protein n=1 Tax=Mytilus edulis TaxID=6550 RepID=A0A8S3SEW8_MYTED|nr:unnamed protein product [Mytilus edulis]